MDVVDLEDPIWVLYCGPKNMRLLITYMQFKDCIVEILWKLHDPDLVPFWMEEQRVIKDEESEYFKMVRIQWWVLVKKDQIWMNNIYMKIVGMGSGNEI